MARISNVAWTAVIRNQDCPRAGEADLIVAEHRNGPTDTVTVAFLAHFSRFTGMAVGMD